MLLDQMVQSFCERASATAEERSGQERGSARQDGEMQRRSAGATDMIAVFLEGCKQGTRPIEKVQGWSQNDAPVPPQKKALSDKSEGAEQT